MHTPVTVTLISPSCTCPVRCGPQATVNLATETALVHVLVPKGSKGQHGAPSPQALAAGDRLTQVRGVMCVLGNVSNGRAHRACSVFCYFFERPPSMRFATALQQKTVA